MNVDKMLSYTKTVTAIKVKMKSGKSMMSSMRIKPC